MGKGGGGESWPPSSGFFKKFANKNAIKSQKGVPPPKNVHCKPYPKQKFGKNVVDPPLDFLNVFVYDRKHGFNQKNMT